MKPAIPFWLELAVCLGMAFCPAVFGEGKPLIAINAQGQQVSAARPGEIISLQVAAQAPPPVFSATTGMVFWCSPPPGTPDLSKPCLTGIQSRVMNWTTSCVSVVVPPNPANQTNNIFFVWVLNADGSLGGYLFGFYPFPPPISVLTQRYENKRGGANTHEHVLTVQSVGSSDFQQLYSIPVAGQVNAQPLLVPQVTWPDGTVKDILIIATMQNYVYAFEVDRAPGTAFEPRILWSLTLGPPLAANFMAMGYSGWTCAGQADLCGGNDDPPDTPWALPPLGSPPGHPKDFGYQMINNEGLYNINPWIGIVSTPVVDASSKKIFVVAKISGPNGPENDLAAIDLPTGVVVTRVKIGGQVLGAAPDSQNGLVTFDQAHHMQRAGLLLQNGNQIYIAFGSHQDTPPWHGWIFRYDFDKAAQTFSQPVVWCSTPNSGGGSIWQAGSGITSDDAGNIYVMTGNGCHLQSNGQCDNGGTNGAPTDPFDTGRSNFADMFVRLSPDLSGATGQAPNDQQWREFGDLDLGSSGPVLIPGMPVAANNGNSNGASVTNMLVGGDKEGKFFVLSTNPQLVMKEQFQVTPPRDSAFWNLNIASGGWYNIHGSPALWRGPQGLMAYVMPERDFLRGYLWDDAAAQFDCKAANGCENSSATTPDQQSNLSSPTCPECMPGGFLTLSSDADATGNGLTGTGVLWASLPARTNDPRLISGASNRVVPGELHAFNAEDLKQDRPDCSTTHWFNCRGDIWNSNNSSGFMYAKFNYPVVANGRVYMGTFGTIADPNGDQTSTGTVMVYGLKQWSKVLRTDFPAQVTAGATFTARVYLLNVGTTAWKKGAYQLSSQGPRDNTAWGMNRVDLPVDVNPGDCAAINLNLTAPNIIGTYNFQWQMVQQNVEWFGETTIGQIQVVWTGPLRRLSAVATPGESLVLPGLQLPLAHVAVMDSQTGQPVAQAQVSLMNGLSSFSQTSGDTGADGTVTLQYAPCSNAVGGPLVTIVPCSGWVTKAGYFPLLFQTPSLTASGTVIPASFNRPQELKVTVTDVDSKTAVPSAAVTIVSSGAVSKPSGTTAADGTVSIPYSCDFPSVCSIKVSKSGYADYSFRPTTY